MKIITIKTQSDYESLPSEFKEFTCIEIRSNEEITVKVTPKNSTVTAYGSSTVIAHNSSTVIAYDSSTVRAYDSSTVRAYNSSTVTMYLTTTLHLASNSAIAFLYDNSHTFIKCDLPVIPVQGPAATITEQKNLITPTFDQWILRGVIYADGIHQTIKNQKTIGDLTLYETDQGFVAQKGSKFAHGKTLEEAKWDLRYKLSDRDTSKYKTWTLDTISLLEDMIEAYMTITGACSFGTKQFCESSKLKESYTVEEVIKLTEGKFGNEEFTNFFTNAKD